MRPENLKKGVVYVHRGIDDGASVIFSPAKDGCMDYHPQGYIVLHWRGNRFEHGYEEGRYKTNEGLLQHVEVAREKTADYYNRCVAAGKDVGGYSGLA